MQRGDMNDELPKTIYWLIKAMIVMCSVAMLAGCKTQERVVTVYSHSTDTLIQTKVERDSIYAHDSIYVRERGDTVWIERWHTRWRDVIKTDTVYRNNVVTEYRDSVTTKEVSKPLTWWQRTQIYAGDVLLIGLFVAAGFGMFKLLKKFKVL